MDTVRLSVFCLAACVLLKLLSSVSPEIKTVASLTAVVMISGFFLSDFSELYDAAKELFENTDLDEGYLNIALKSVGICYVTQISADCCRDSGETALASQLELAGKAALLITAIPMFSAVAKIISSLLIL